MGQVQLDCLFLQSRNATWGSDYLNRQASVTDAVRICLATKAGDKVYHQRSEVCPRSHRYLDGECPRLVPYIWGL